MSRDETDEASQPGDPDFSIGPNAEYYVTRPDDQFERLKRFIESSNGGVFGLTGVRGAGKSVLLKKVEMEFAGKHHTLHIPAPVSSKEEAAFFAMLFRLLCGSVIEYIDEKIFRRKSGAAQGVDPAGPDRALHRLHSRRSAGPRCQVWQPETHHLH